MSDKAELQRVYQVCKSLNRRCSCEARGTQPCESIVDESAEDERARMSSERDGAKFELEDLG